MNIKEHKQIYRLCASMAEAAKGMNRFAKAIRRATLSMSELPALVAAAKKKHGLTDR